jgi:fructose-1,6-bisphosphatase/inositol monophosphatase family enzyme
MRRIDDQLAWVEAKLRECRRMALRYFQTRLRVERKADRTPVTIADRKIEEYLRRELARAFPKDAIVGEEFGAPSQRGSSFWTIDPIDGTRAFSRGLPSWGILLGRVEHGKAVLGACDFPAIGTFVGVSPGTPAYEHQQGGRRRLPPARRLTALSDAVIFHGGSGWWLSTRYTKGFQRLVRMCFLERAYGDCYAYLWVLRGNADAMLDYGVKIWDLVPFAALASATGRVLVDFSGRPSFTGPESILAHHALARLIVKILHEQRPRSTVHRPQ